MIEVLNNSIVWWHWVALGLILVFTEMATGTFISLGLGIAAILVGMIDLIVPIGLLYQLVVWILLSLLCVWLLSLPSLRLAAFQKIQKSAYYFRERAVWFSSGYTRQCHQAYLSAPKRQSTL